MATGQREGGYTHRLGQCLGSRGVSCCVCAVVKLPSRLLAARRQGLADLGLSQCPGSPQTHSSAGWSRKPDPRLQGLSSKVC